MNWVPRHPLRCRCRAHGGAHRQRSGSMRQPVFWLLFPFALAALTAASLLHLI